MAPSNPSLTDLLRQADADLFSETRAATLLDVSFAEALRSRGIATDTKHVLGFDGDWHRLSAPLRLLQPQAVFVLCLGTLQQADSLKQLFRSAHITPRRVCLLLPTSANLYLGSSEVMDLFSLKFLPFKVSIAYLPVYLNPVLKPSDHLNLEVHILSNHLCRDAFPPLLLRSETVAEKGSSASIADRLSPVARRRLKVTTHELAGALLSLGRVRSCSMP